MKAWRLKVVLTALLVAGAAVTTSTPPAHATAPGSNGRIAFGRYNPDAGDDAIYTANPDGTGVVQIFAGPAESPRWSPDGTRLAISCFQNDFEFVRNCTMSPDGSGFVQLLADPTLNEGAGGWSPDGIRLAFEGWDGVYPERTPGVFTMRAADGGDLRRVTTNPYGGHDIPADYAPDGSRLLFFRENPPLGRHAVFVVNLDGSRLRQLTPWGLDAVDPRWAPGGAQIVFASKGSIFVARPDGTGLVKIYEETQHGAAFYPCWSPDGTRILFARFVVDRGQKTAQEDLYTMKPDGSGITRVTNTPAFESTPDWGAYTH